MLKHDTSTANEESTPSLQPGVNDQEPIIPNCTRRGTQDALATTADSVNTLGSSPPAGQAAQGPAGGRGGDSPIYG